MRRCIQCTECTELNVLKLMDAGYCLYVHIFMKNIKSLEDYTEVQEPIGGYNNDVVLQKKNVCRTASGDLDGPRKQWYYRTALCTVNHLGCDG